MKASKVTKQAKSHGSLLLWIFTLMLLAPVLGVCQDINVFALPKNSMGYSSKNTQVNLQVGGLKKLFNNQNIAARKSKVPAQYWHGYMLTEDGQEYYWVDEHPLSSSEFQQSKAPLQWMCALDAIYCPALAFHIDVSEPM